MTEHWSDPWVDLRHGEVRAELAALPEASIDCIVTSPPYWSLRDYNLPPAAWGGDPGHEHVWGDAVPLPNDVQTGTGRWQHQTNGEGRSYDVGDYRTKTGDQGRYCACGAWLGQLGLEPDDRDYIDHILEVLDACWRVLKPEGTLWLNLGDTYAAKGRGSDAGWDKSRLRNPGRSQKAQSAALRNRHRQGERHRGKASGLKEKDRAMIPARVAIAAREAGWYLRDEIVWHKNNPMPSSTEDRTTPSHEMIYLLAKRRVYHYDGAAIAEVAVSAAEARWDPGTSHLSGSDRKTGRSTRRFPKGWDAEPGDHGTIHRQGRNGATERELATIGHVSPATERRMVGLNARWPGIGATASARRDKMGSRTTRGDNTVAIVATPTRNARSVWTIATQPFPNAHFATFPERLAEKMIRAGCPEGGTVLDPFAGAGTVLLTAKRLRRHSIGIELGEQYLAMIVDRVSTEFPDAPLAGDDGEIPVDSLWAAAAP